MGLFEAGIDKIDRIDMIDWIDGIDRRDEGMDMMGIRGGERRTSALRREADAI